MSNIKSGGSSFIIGVLKSENVFKEFGEDLKKKIELKYGEKIAVRNGDSQKFSYDIKDRTAVNH